MYFHYALVVTLPASNYIHGERYVAKSRPFRNSKSDVKEKIEELATTFEPSPKLMKAPRSYSPVVSTSLHPTKFPSKLPTKVPSKLPTKVPSKQPTNYPTQIPSIQVVSCYDVPGWHDSDGEKFGCAWYEKDVTLDDYYGEGDTRCELWGYSFQNYGFTANTACCACGGGYIEINKKKNAPSISPSISLKPTKTSPPSTSPSLSALPTEFCRDISEWHDSDGPRGSCEWYGEDVGDDDDYYNEGDTRCVRFGHLYENFGMTANDACCACSGGYKLGQDPSVAPSLSLQPTKLVRGPTSFPTISLKPTSSAAPTEFCEDVENWYDSGGYRYDCNWYGRPIGDDDVYYDDGETDRCLKWGDGYDNFGHNALTACCVCGGGYRGFDDSSSKPSHYPTTVSTSANDSPAPTYMPTQLDDSSSKPSHYPTTVSTSANDSPAPTYMPTQLYFEYSVAPTSISERNNGVLNVTYAPSPSPINSATASFVPNSSNSDVLSISLVHLSTGTLTLLMYKMLT